MTGLEIFLLIIIVALLAIMWYGFVMGSRKIEFYEDWVSLLKKNVNSIFQEMQAIDTRGSFEADDEVGLIFTSLRSLIGELNKYITGE